MSRKIEELLAEAMKLPPAARANRARSLIASLDESVDDAEAAWQAEIARRLEEIDNGDVKLVSWSEARRQILRK